MKTVLLCLLLVVSTNVFAQIPAPEIQWQKSYGGSDISSIQATPDGGSIMAGSADPGNVNVSGNHGNSDFWVIKLTSAGAVEWQKSLGGSGGDNAYAIQLAKDGGYIVTGTTNSNNGDVSGNHGSGDYWVVKLTATGTIEWQKCLGGSRGDIPQSLQTTPDGGYIIAGYSQSVDGDVTGNHGSWDYWVVKLTSSGLIEWQKSLGGTGQDDGNSIQVAGDGGYIVAGVSYSNDGDVSGNHGSGDY